METQKLMRPGREIGKGAPEFLSGEWSMELKVDGHSGRIIVDEHGKGRCFTATREVTDLLPTLHVHQVADSIFQVEWAAGKRSTSAQVSSFLSKGGWRKVEKPRAVILHVLRFRGRDLRSLPYLRNVTYRETVAKALWSRWAILTETPSMVFWATARKSRLEYWEQRGEEGVVLKRKLAPYVPGRSKDWAKFKFTSTLDAWVTGYIPGNGRLKGMVGSLILQLFNGNGSALEIGTCSGMDDATRQILTKRLDAGDSFAVEVRFERWTSGNRLRHPRFLRVRDGKPRKDCSLAIQAPHLLGGARC